VDHRHTRLLADFIRQTWDPSATEERVRRARQRAAQDNPAAAGEEAPTFLFLSGDQPLGHVTTIPIRLWLRSHTVPAHWVKGLMVAPAHRGGPVGFLLLKGAQQHLDLALAMVVERVPIRLFEALGFQDLGALPNYLRLLKPAKVLRRLDLSALDLQGIPRGLAWAARFAQRSGMATATGLGLGGLTNLWTAAGRGVRLRSEAREQLGLDADEIWARMSEAVSASPVRDAAYLRWRYAQGSVGHYRSVSVFDGSHPRGLAVVRRPSDEGDPRLKGIRIAVLSELLFPPDRPAIGLAVLAAAENLARELGADALLFSGSHGCSRQLLRKRAFIPVSGNVHVLVRGLPKNLQPVPELSDWWLTRGDSNADESF
jgi:GNAT superfamily N-acetyltransferase